jgi:hypothetical protein
MDFTDGAGSSPEEKPNLGSNAGRITRRTDQSHAKTGFGTNIMVQNRFGSVLGHRQVHPAISVKISNSGPALLTVNKDSGVLSRD